MIVGEKEIARHLEVQENTVHQWMVRGMLPEPDGSVSGNPAWQWDTIEEWAWRTGRFPDLRVRILALLARSPAGGDFATPITQALVAGGWVGHDTSPRKVASILTDLFNEGLVSIHLRNEWRITDAGRAFLSDRSADLEHRYMAREPGPAEIARLFTQWEYAASQSPNRAVASSAPLPPPSEEEAAEMLTRLRQIRRSIASSDVDWHGRPMGDRDQAALGQLWEEWRDDKLEAKNGYREVWQRPDPFYDSAKA